VRKIDSTQNEDTLSNINLVFKDNETVYERIIEELMIRFNIWPQGGLSTEEFNLRYGLIKKLLTLRDDNDFNISHAEKELFIPEKLDLEYFKDIEKSFVKLHPNSIELTSYNGFKIFPQDTIENRKENKEKVNDHASFNFDKWLMILYKKIPENGMKLAKLKNHTSIFKSNKALFDVVVGEGVRKGLFLIQTKTNYTKRKRFVLIPNFKHKFEESPDMIYIKKQTEEELKNIHSKNASFSNASKYICLKLTEQENLTKLKDLTVFRGINTEEFIKVCKFGEKKGFFKIKQIKLKARGSLIITKIENKKVGKFISKQERILKEEKSGLMRKNISSIRQNFNEDLCSLLTELYDFLDEPRKLKDIKNFIKKVTKNPGFYLDDKIKTIEPVWDSKRIQWFIHFLVLKSINSDFYLRRDIIYKKHDHLGFYVANSNIIFHIGNFVPREQQVYKKNHRKFQIIEIVAHLLKYGMSSTVFKVIQQIADIRPKRSHDLYKSIQKYNLISAKDVQYETHSIKLVVSKYRSVSLHQIDMRDRFWLTYIENHQKLVEFVFKKILNGGVKEGFLIPRKMRRALLQISREYRLYTKDMKIKKPNSFDYKRLPDTYACAHVIMGGNIFIFFDKKTNYELVESLLYENQQRIIHSARLGIINGPRSFYRLIEFWHKKGLKILDYAWTHGKHLSKWGGFKLPIEKIGRTELVEVDGYVIYRHQDRTFLALIQHKDGKYSPSECRDLLRVANSDVSIFNRYKKMRGFHLLENVNVIETVFLVRFRDNLVSSDSVLSQSSNFRVITYQDIDYEPIDEKNLDILDIKNLQRILVQTFKDRTRHISEMSSVVECLSDLNVLDFKMNGECAAVIVDNKGNVVCRKKNSETKVVLPTKYIEQFQQFKNSSFKIELMFANRKTLRKVQAMSIDHLLDLSVLENNFFIIITDVYGLYGLKYFLSGAYLRRSILEDIFIKNADKYDFLKHKTSDSLLELYKKNPLDYLKYCGKNQILAICPGIRFKKNNEGVKTLLEFTKKYSGLIDLPFPNFYSNIDGFMLKTDLYDLYKGIIRDHEAIKIKTAQTYTVLLWATIKGVGHFRGGRGLLVAWNPATNFYSPVATTPVKNTVATTNYWNILEEPILLDVAFPKGLWSNTINHVKIIGMRQNAKLDNISKITKNHKIPTRVFEIFENIKSHLTLSNKRN